MAADMTLDERRAVLEQRISGIRRGKFDVEIISSVRDRPELYDKSHENHKNPAVKELEWKRIAIKLKAPVGAVMKRWTVIRERFTAEKRKVIPLGPSSWWLMEHMNWLDSHIQPRQRNNSNNSKNYRTDLPGGIVNYPSIRYIDVGEDNNQQGPESPPLPIAYPEVLMESQSPPQSSSNSIDGDYLTVNNFHGLMKGRRETAGSEGSQSGHNGSMWSSAGLDLDEAAAARILAGLRSVMHPVLRHRLRIKVHHLCEELEIAGIQDWNPEDGFREER